jgi:hypothetical protein
MNPGSFPPLPPRTELGVPAVPELSPDELFSHAARITGSHHVGEPLADNLIPEEVVMGVIANFSGDPNITACERGVLLHMVVEMKSDNGISMDEARSFANQVEAMTRGVSNFEPS